MRGNTLSVSNAGNSTARCESIVKTRGVDLCPQEKPSKLRLHEGNMAGPNATAHKHPIAMYKMQVVARAETKTFPAEDRRASNDNGCSKPGTECWNSWLNRAVENMMLKPLHWASGGIIDDSPKIAESDSPEAADPAPPVANVVMAPPIMTARATPRMTAMDTCTAAVSNRSMQLNGTTASEKNTPIHSADTSPYRDPL
eukprot:FR740519.1.p2 GENE.FR740519.1~~FR740519.1.p2  ORF type:complete len:199 (-),score=13.02 FR740519.1:3-599(-)